MDSWSGTTPFAYYRGGRIANARLMVRRIDRGWLITDSRWPREGYVCSTEEEADELVADIVRSEEAAVKAAARSAMAREGEAAGSA